MSGDAWQTVDLRSVASVTVGGTPSTEVPAFWDGTIPWMTSGDVHQRRVLDVPGRITDVGLRFSNATLVDPLSVAIALAGQGKTRGTAALIETRLCTNQSVALLVGDGERLLTTYLFHDLGHRYEELRGRSLGGGRGGLSKSILEALPVCLPAIGQQRKIAAILDAADAAITGTELLLAKLAQRRQGLLHRLLTCGIEDSGEVRDQVRHPELFVERSIGLVPKTWSVACLSDLADRTPGSTTIGPFGSNLLATDYRPSGVPVVFVRDIRESEFCWVSNVYVSVTKAKTLAAHSAQPGDVIASKMGLPPCVAAVYPESLGHAVITADVVRIRPDTTKSSPAWLAAAINSHPVRRQVRGITGGVTRPKVTLADFRRLTVAVPPLAEQHAIAAIIAADEARRRSEEHALHKLRRLKQGLLDDLLAGKVRVNVDNEDTV